MKPEASGDNGGDKVEACPSPVSKNNLLPPPCSCSFLICLVVGGAGLGLSSDKTLSSFPKPQFPFLGSRKLN